MTTAPIVARTLGTLHEVLSHWQSTGVTYSLVPTMGALHDGHLELVRLARTHANRVVASIFVNPAQFGPSEDLARYPRDEEGDLVKLTAAGCDLVWAPDPAAMYPAGFATRIIPEGAALGLEADFRPNFFSGVVTVCCKLFNQVAPSSAVFGEKDFQQLCVVRQLVRDMDMPVTIIGAPTVREPDGLALSSRNRYLRPEERHLAPALHEAIQAVARGIGAGADIEAETLEAVRILSWKGFQVDYVAVRDAVTLGRPQGARNFPMRVLAAARLGNTRLIDNVPA